MVLYIGGAYQGKRALASEYLIEHGLSSIVTDFHLRIRDAVMAEEDPEELTRQLLQDDPDVVTMDEVGYGIVPMEKKEREYREAVGHAGQKIAARADEVYRVVSGIAVRIK